ncbi:MAG: adenylate/guanylate cyclase domain-containing protein [Cyanobacteria bacterium P01_F01_bin.150]
MVNLAGYQTHSTHLYESTNSLVYRARRLSDGCPVVLKMLKQNCPSSVELTRYRQEYEITRSLGSSGIIRAYQLQSYQQTLVMVLEDFGGGSLHQFLDQIAVNLSYFLKIAIKITRALSEVHQARVIHKDINPSNIIYNPQTEELKLIDFGISSRVVQSSTTFKNPDVLEGTLSYISPEQTGRTNRFIDYRTDFYSLGITFYELLTRQLPFQTSALADSLELVHYHLAKEPISPQDINPDIPDVIANIVLKLIRKNPEDRYKSTAGIQHDLEAYLYQLEQGKDNIYFPIASQDHTAELKIPQKLYGRAHEIKLLLTAFQRISAEFIKINQTERLLPCSADLVLVTGYSGIGKSALVRELYKDITHKRGYFVAGKFNQLQRNIPYSAIVDSFNDLVRQLLTESPDVLEHWRQKIQSSLGKNGQVIVDIIPDIELIIGPQPSLPALGPNETQNRFRLVFQKFVRVFSSLDHPFVIFLDDLQWADAASLQLLQLILTDEETRSLLLIGAYRDNEVSGTHPLTMKLQELEADGIFPMTIVLSPLTLEHLQELLMDTFHCDRATTMPLAQLVHQKTGGNPFFANEFLKVLVDEQHIYFDMDQRRWCWDMQTLQDLDITDNVVELMMGRLRKLPPNTQHILCLAACIGANFDLETLAIISQQSKSDIFHHLLVSVQAGLILTQSEPDEDLVIQQYKFLHDRVQQAAYALIEPDQKATLHLTIGRLLRNSLIEPNDANVDKNKEDDTPSPLSCSDDQLFKIVDHLNIGRSLLTTNDEQLELAKFNLIAAQKAKESTAHSAAHNYLSTGLEILDRNHTSSEAWQSYYSLTYGLYYEQAEVEYFLGNFNESKRLLELILEQAQSVIDKANAYSLLVVESTLETRYSDALAYGQRALSLLGIDFPKDDFEVAFKDIYAEYKEGLGDRSISDLLSLPEVEDTEKKLAIQILSNMGSATFRYDRTTWQVVVLTSILLFLDYGNAPESCYGYSTLGTFLGSVIGDYQAGYEACSVAIELSDRYEDLTQKSRACFIMSNFIHFWVKPIQLADAINQEGARAGLESGEVQYVGYTLSYRISNLFAQGKPLASVLESLYEALNFCQKANNQWSVDVLLGYQRVFYNLMDFSDGASDNTDEHTDQYEDFSLEKVSDADYIQQCQINNSYSGLCRYFIAKAIALYLYGNYTQALEHLEQAKPLAKYATGVFSNAELNMYESLTLIQLYEKKNSSNTSTAISSKDNQTILQTISQNQTQLKKWADGCPDNFLHKYWLVEAEMARISDLIALEVADSENNFLESNFSAHGFGNRPQTRRPIAAITLYDQAIAAATALDDFLQDEALANELAGGFWLQHQKPDFALGYLNRARYAYENWGAERKVKQFNEKYAQWIGVTASQQVFQEATIQKTNSISTSSKGEQLDLETVMKASQAIASEIKLDKLLAMLMEVLIENAGAQSGHLLLEKNGDYYIEAISLVDEGTKICNALPVGDRLPAGILNFVMRTQKSVVLNNAVENGDFTRDPYIKVQRPQSVLCTPLLNQGRLVGLLYLENNLTTGAFTSDRIELLSLLSSQTAISIENARLYDTLEKKVAERTQELADEQEKSERLLRNILPESIANRLKQDEQAIAEDFDAVTVLFSDIVGFTQLSSQISPERLVDFLNQVFSAFDKLCDRHGLEKIKTIGDAYMVVGGLPEPKADHAEAIANMALDMQRIISTIAYPLPVEPNAPYPLAIRIGIHTGPVVAGVIGKKKFTYDLWGDTVNVASRMESHGAPGRIQVSEATYQHLKHRYHLDQRGLVPVKGRGKMITYWLNGPCD